MRYIKFSGGTSYCGMDFECVDDFETDEERDEYYEAAYCD